MKAVTHVHGFQGRSPGHDLARGSVRFAAEVVTMVVITLTLWSHSILLAIVALVVLVGLPAVFSTPGDRPGGDGPVAVPGFVTILILIASLAVGVVCAWLIWPWWAATVVTALCATVVFTEQPRWRSLRSTNRHQSATPSR